MPFSLVMRMFFLWLPYAYFLLFERKIAGIAKRNTRAGIEGMLQPLLPETGSFSLALTIAEGPIILPLTIPSRSNFPPSFINRTR